MSTGASDKSAFQQAAARGGNMMSELPNFLRSLPLFVSISDVEIPRISAVMSQRNFAKGGVVFRQGDSGDAFYIVLSGVAHVMVDKRAKKG